MVLEAFISQKRATILERWFALVLETYPADTSGFVSQEKDRFTNPMGYMISREIDALFEELVQGMNSDKLSTCLGNILRLRSVQDFSPSQAVSFILFLKKVIREELGSEIRENRVFEELLRFESRIDELALLAFDIHMQCREKTYEIKVNEVKAQREMAFKLVERANIISGKLEGEPDIKD